MAFLSLPRPAERVDLLSTVLYSNGDLTLEHNKYYSNYIVSACDRNCNIINAIANVKSRCSLEYQHLHFTDETTNPIYELIGNILVNI